MNISLQNIIKATEFYKSKDFKLIDAPLVVDRDISALTKPVGLPDLNHIEDKVYVASAEQSFLQMIKEGRLETGRYMAYTPCYRHEPVLDDIHFSVFSKLELFCKGYREPITFITYAERFYESLGLEVIIVKTEIGWDICAVRNKELVELGSYGFRYDSNGHVYTYGTAIAEPRTSILIGGQ